VPMMEQQTGRFPPATSPVQEDGWLSPDGVYYPCGFWNHFEAAMEIAGVGPSDLEERGWVHISDSQISVQRGLTQPQMDTLFDMQMVDPGSCLGMNIARHLGR
jgi:hypothetical protein